MYYKGFVVTIVALCATIVALGAGILVRLDGGTYVKSVQNGAMSFAAAMTLGLLVAGALGAL
ncbi:hypothetical protein OIE68_31975 [Nocardia vinacea]|uniref:hypothetical protein n=1 Tax=Nocardia vinacea TaxID=96468 RepID=UPI002E11838F|nr:hypothetical protein OIE68_31975 [Nocardia vinacea]